MVEPPHPTSPLPFHTQSAAPKTTATTTSPAAVTPTPPISPSSPSPPSQEVPPSSPQPQTGPGPDASPHQPIPPISPHSLSPGPGTAELTNDLDQISSEQGRLPLPTGAFAYNGEEPFITAAAIKYLQGIHAGQSWTAMVTSYLHLEEFPIADAMRTFLFLSFAQTDDIIRPMFVFPLNLGQTRSNNGQRNGPSQKSTPLLSPTSPHIARAGYYGGLHASHPGARGSGRFQGTMKGPPIGPK